MVATLSPVTKPCAPDRSNVNHRDSDNYGDTYGWLLTAGPRLVTEVQNRVRQLEQSSFLQERSVIVKTEKHPNSPNMCTWLICTNFTMLLDLHGFKDPVISPCSLIDGTFYMVSVALPQSTGPDPTLPKPTQDDDLPSNNAMNGQEGPVPDERDRDSLENTLRKFSFRFGETTSEFQFDAHPSSWRHSTPPVAPKDSETSASSSLPAFSDSSLHSTAVASVSLQMTHCPSLSAAQCCDPPDTPSPAGPTTLNGCVTSQVSLDDEGTGDGVPINCLSRSDTNDSLQAETESSSGSEPLSSSVDVSFANLPHSSGTPSSNITDLPAPLSDSVMNVNDETRFTTEGAGPETRRADTSSSRVSPVLPIHEHDGPEEVPAPNIDRTDLATSGPAFGLGTPRDLVHPTQLDSSQDSTISPVTSSCLPLVAAVDGDSETVPTIADNHSDSEFASDSPPFRSGHEPREDDAGESNGPHVAMIPIRPTRELDPWRTSSLDSIIGSVHVPEDARPSFMLHDPWLGCDEYEKRFSSSNPESSCPMLPPQDKTNLYAHSVVIILGPTFVRAKEPVTEPIGMKALTPFKYYLAWAVNVIILSLLFYIILD